MSKSCSKCSAIVEDAAIFCPECGSRIDVSKIKNKNFKRDFSLLGKIVLIVVLCFGWVALFMIFGKSASNLEEFEAVNVIFGPMGGDVGEIGKNDIELKVSEGTFDSNVGLKVTVSNETPPFDKSQVSMIGSLYDIAITQKTKRLHKPVMVKLKLYAGQVEALTYPNDLRIGYYDGAKWYFFKPDELNIEDNYLTFNTWHFSKYRVAGLKKEKLVKNFAYENAVEKWAKKNSSGSIKKAVEKILSEKLGVNNKSFAQDVAESIMNEGHFVKLAVSYNDNKMDKFGTDLAVLAGKKIVSILANNESVAKDVLGTISKHASKIGTAVKMAVAIENGDYEQAAKELSNEIISSYPITKLFKEGARVVGNEIARWKQKGVEEAFDVYVNGGKRYGYDNPETFDELWEQMDGVSRQLLIDARAAYAKAHNILPSKISNSERVQIDQRVKSGLEESFKKRKKEDAFIKKEQERNIKLIKIFEEYKLLRKNSNGYTKQTSFDLMLRRLFLLKDMILKDTNSKLGFKGVYENGMISAKRVARLIGIWYEKPDGKKRYRKELERLGYIKKKIKPLISLDRRLFGRWINKNSDGSLNIQIFKENGTTVRVLHGQRYIWLWKAKSGVLTIWVKGAKPANQRYKINGGRLSFYLPSVKIWSVPYTKQ